MLDALRFVASAVAKKDFVPELTHFKIAAGRVTGFNGQIALSSPIDVDLDIRPQALALIAAIRACPGVIALGVTAAGRLGVRSEGFRAYVQCLADDHAHFVQPEGETVELGEHFMAGIKAVAPIMGVDASRPWSMGIKLSKQTMLATNNVMLAEFWHGANIPIDVVIPAAAVAELLRIGETPLRAQVTDTSLSFWFEGDRWMRTQLLIGGSWPVDKIDKILSLDGSEQMPVPAAFAETVERLKPFLEKERNTVYVTAEGLSTSLAEGDGAGESLPMPGVTQPQAYHHRQLTLLAEVAQTIDWRNYPQPCIFQADRLRGAIIGQRI